MPHPRRVGPLEAIETSLGETEDFVSDRMREPLVLTDSPKGYLKRVK